MAKTQKNTENSEEWRLPRSKAIIVDGSSVLIADRNKTNKLLDEDSVKTLPIELQGLKEGEVVSIKAKSYEINKSEEMEK